MNPLLIRRHEMMTGKSLPYDAQIQYLSTDPSVLPSTGNGGTVQYIRTGCYPTPRTRIKVKFRFADKLKQRGIFGCYGTLYYSVYINGGIQLATSFSDNSGDWKATGIAPNINSDQTIEMKPDTLQVLVNNQVKTTRTVSPQNNASNEIILMGGHARGMQFNGRLYYFFANDVDTGIYLIDLIPVRVGQVGYMYDRVSGQLFGNEGTGAFILGPDVQ